MGKRKRTAQRRKNAGNAAVQNDRKFCQTSAAPAAVGQIRDANSRMIFKDAGLCAQFLRDNVDIPLLKEVQPEDITDVSEQYQAYLGIQFETDTVKKIRLHDADADELFLISLIEHKSRVDYNIAMQLFRYMVCIWTEYAREMEAKQAGISRTKAFRYPPVLPIVYYEGAENWTADMHLRDRIHLNGIFRKYIPDFTYQVVRIHDYTNEELLSRENEMSFLMMINRIQTPGDLSEFLQVEQEKVARIVEKAPPRTLEIIAETIWSLCMKMNIPFHEAEECVKKVKDRDMGYLFENMEKMDIQEERRKTEEARNEAEEARNEAEEARNEAKEARSEAEEARSEAKEARTVGMKNIVLLCRKFGASKENAVQELMNAYALDREAALEKVRQFWEGEPNK